MNLIQRVQDILLKPKDTWPVIEQEPGDVASIYKNYVAILAAIPAVAKFIGFSIFGFGMFGVSIGQPVVSGLVQGVIGYVLSLVIAYLLALVVDALAPSFGGTKSTLNAFKVVAYGSTAMYVGGIFFLIPSLSMLSLLATLYGIYLVYTGLPVLMKCPQDKAVGYTAVIFVIGFVAMLILGAVTAMFMPHSAFRMGGLGGGSGDIRISTPRGEVNVDTTKLEEMSKRMEEAGKRVEAAKASGDPAAAGKAAAEMMGAMAGVSGTPIPAADLKAMLPESLGDMKRESIEAVGNQAMGIATSSVNASYAAGDKRVKLSIIDSGGFGALAGLAGWANMTVDRETDGKIEKVYKLGKRTVREEYQKDGSRTEFMVILENGVLVEADGNGVDLAAVKAVVAAVPLDKLEAMKRVAKQ